MTTSIKSNSGIGAGGALNLIPVKVMSVILDINHELAEKSGGFDSVGTIFYIKVGDTKDNPILENPEKGQKISDMLSAKPLFANQKIYPLKGEIVLLVSGTGRDIDKDLRQSYYLPNINIWNSIHHNAIPNVESYLDKEEVKNDYPETTGGIIRTVTDGGTDIPLGEYFNERLNTKPLLPYEGDFLLEGRFGNSIRFGSTNISNKIIDASKNPWSSIGVVGDPITIIRNGQNPDAGVEGWIPTIENVNTDGSSIYLTSNQKIENLQVASNHWASWEAVVEIPNDTTPKLTNTEVIVADTEPETVEVEKTIIKEEKQELEKEEAVTTTEEEKIEPVEITTTVEEEIGLIDELIESGDFTDEDFATDLVEWVDDGVTVVTPWWEVPNSNEGTVTSDDGTTTKKIKKNNPLIKSTKTGCSRYPVDNINSLIQAMNRYAALGTVQGFDTKFLGNHYIQVGILACCAKECSLKPKGEKTWKNTSEERMRKVFGSTIKHMTSQDIKDLGPSWAGGGWNEEKWWDITYGVYGAGTKLNFGSKKIAFSSKYGAGRADKYGHNKVGDGWAYRGRGFNQITWKVTYKKVGEIMQNANGWSTNKVLSNPDMLNDVDYAAESALAFYMKRFRYPHYKKYCETWGTTGGFQNVDNYYDGLGMLFNSTCGWGKSKAYVEGHDGFKKMQKSHGCFIDYVTQLGTSA